MQSVDEWSCVSTGAVAEQTVRHCWCECIQHSPSRRTTPSTVSWPYLLTWDFLAAQRRPRARNAWLTCPTAATSHRPIHLQ